MSRACSLCRSENIEVFSKFDEKIFGEFRPRLYFCCRQCYLIFLAPEMRLEAQTEKNRYVSHENNEGDVGYVKFLNQIITPLEINLSNGANGHDFGCGPNPVLAKLLVKKKFQMNFYDPFFFPDQAVFKFKYDFVTCTEVLEHVYDLESTVDMILSLLKPKGIFGFMTSLYNPKIDFKNWTYRRDDTHVHFFQKETLEYLLRSRNLKPAFSDDKKVFIFQKND